ncbi:MAG: hypothetical protein ABI680_18915, partial [Chthoniobacteraceae bacterium]
MDKKSIFILLAAVAGLVAWQVHQGKRLAEYRVAKEAYDKAVAETAAKNPAPPIAPATPGPDATANAAAPTPVAPPAVVEPAPEKKMVEVSTSLVDYSFTNLGGGIETAKLLHHIISKKDGRDVVMNEFGEIPIGAVSETPGEGTGKEFSVSRDATKRTVTFERTEPSQILLRKTFTLPEFASLKANSAERLREEYLLHLDLTFTNGAATPAAVPAYYVYTGSASPLHARDLPLYIGFNYFRDDRNKFINATWFDGGGILFFKKPPRAVYPDPPEKMPDVRWAATTNQYFTTFIAPVVDPQALSA